MPGLHPAIVHFPLALILTAAACLTLARLPAAAAHCGPLALVGTWNLCFGALASVAALGSGLAASLDVPAGAAVHAAISSHFRSAVLSAMLGLAAALWRGFGAPMQSRPSWLFLLLLWAATGSFIVTGYRGGQNVYRYGVGVLPAAQLYKKTPCPQEQDTAQAGRVVERIAPSAGIAIERAAFDDNRHGRGYEAAPSI